jgi:hypothetical protein
MNMKTKIITIALISLLSLSLFATLQLQPAQAILPLQEVFSLKEYKLRSSYNPDYTFSRVGSNLRMHSTQASLGCAYAMIHMNKNDLDGNKLRISWRWYLDWSNVQYTLGELYVVDNLHNRKYSNQQEFVTANDIEHPIADYTNIQACSLTETCNGGWVSTRVDTSPVLNLNGWGSSVTVMIKSVDPWIANVVELEVNYLQILDSNNNVLKTYYFDGKIWMEKTGTYYDYGQIRDPTSTLYGTEEYAIGGVPPNELYLSQQVSSYVYSLFSGTSKYNSLSNAFGYNTNPTNGYNRNYANERYYDYSTVFYKGHIWFNTAPCGAPGCTLTHTGIWGNNDLQSGAILDYDIDAALKSAKASTGKVAGTHDFIFLWSCGHASTTYIGNYGSHSHGAMASWMQLDPYTLSSNAYANPDYSDHVFISFDWLSIWYGYQTSNPIYDHAQWAALFYYYLLDQGYTVNEALDQATRDSYYNSSFGQSPLYNNFNMWNPQTQKYDYSKMHLWGDGTVRLPR